MKTANTDFDASLLEQELIRDEGEVLHAYPDSSGYLKLTWIGLSLGGESCRRRSSESSSISVFSLGSLACSSSRRC